MSIRLGQMRCATRADGTDLFGSGCAHKLPDLALELVPSERSADISSYAIFRGCCDMFAIVHYCQHDKGNGYVSHTDSPQQIKAGQFQHIPVADDQIKLTLGIVIQLPRVLAAARKMGARDSHTFEGVFQDGANIWLVVDDYDFKSESSLAEGAFMYRILQTYRYF